MLLALPGPGFSSELPLGRKHERGENESQHQPLKAPTSDAVPGDAAFGTTDLAKAWSASVATPTACRTGTATLHGGAHACRRGRIFEEGTLVATHPVRGCHQHPVFRVITGASANGRCAGTPEGESEYYNIAFRHGG